MNPEVLFFGCTGQSGHYLHARGRNVRFDSTPWGNRLDTGLLDGIDDDYYDPKDRGNFSENHKGGWTAIAFWDRSGPDNRPGCNTAFLVAREITWQELVALAIEQWPEIWHRPGFPMLKEKPTKCNLTAS